VDSRVNINIIERKADDYLEVARSLAINKRIDESLYYYRECLQIFEEMGFISQINRVIWEIEKVLNGETSSLNYLKYDAFQELDHVRKDIILERLQKYESGKTWLEKKEQMLEKTLFDAKKYADEGKYAKAKLFYRHASKILKMIGWEKEMNVILNEIKMLDEKIIIQEETEKIETQLAIQKKQELQRYLNEESEKIEQKRRENRFIPLVPSPEEEMHKKKFQIAELNLIKAQEAEQAENYQLALNRYKYLFEIYQQLNYDPIKKERITQKISEMEDRIKVL